jgi:hypothetical protein
MEGGEVPFEDEPTVEESISVILDTLVLIPEDMTCYLVFRAVCPLSSLDASEVALIKITL